jgi:hypothetical protein
MDWIRFEELKRKNERLTGLLLASTSIAERQAVLQEQKCVLIEMRKLVTSEEPGLAQSELPMQHPE